MARAFEWCETSHRQGHANRPSCREPAQFLRRPFEMDVGRMARPLSDRDTADESERSSLYAFQTGRLPPR